MMHSGDHRYAGWMAAIPHLSRNSHHPFAGIDNERCKSVCYTIIAGEIFPSQNETIGMRPGKNKQNTNYDWIGACHACELSYVFHNLTDEQFSGKVVPELADAVCGAWASFAVNGVPVIDGIEWPEYSPDNRETLIFNDDCSISVENDPKSEERQLIETILHYYVAM